MAFMRYELMEKEKTRFSIEMRWRKIENESTGQMIFKDGDRGRKERDYM